VTWESPATISPTGSIAESVVQIQNHGLLFDDIFYLTAPVKWSDGWFYAIGKTQEDSVGSTILCRSRSLAGPFERGPLLARGMRHGDMHLAGNKILIFYTLIEDAPERILLATLETRDSSDWESWKLLPGPIILTPTLAFEHGNVNVTKPRESGSAGCTAHAQSRDPSFLRDKMTGDDNHHRLTGTLFYSVQGDGAFAASRLDIDLDALAPATRYRDKRLIPDEILQASSLASSNRKRNLFPSNGSNGNDGTSNNDDVVESSGALFTGSGRTGTGFLCKMFQAVGLNISHDNDIDCGYV
jgi:hypothetical protein